MKDKIELKRKNTYLKIARFIKGYIKEVFERVNPVIEIIMKEDFPSNCGYYYSGLNNLGINVCELSAPKELINTVAHELRHAYQEQRAMDPKTEMDYLIFMYR